MEILRDLVALLVIGALIVAGVFSFLIMPRQRVWKQRQEFVRTMKIGTRVLTYGGIVGAIKRIDRQTGLVTIEVASGIELDFVASAIMSEFDEKSYAEAAQKHMQ